MACFFQLEIWLGWTLYFQANSKIVRFRSCVQFYLGFDSGLNFLFFWDMIAHLWVFYVHLNAWFSFLDPLLAEEASLTIMSSEPSRM